MACVMLLRVCAAEEKLSNKLSLPHSCSGELRPLNRAVICGLDRPARGRTAADVIRGDTADHLVFCLASPTAIVYSSCAAMSTAQPIIGPMAKSYVLPPVTKRNANETAGGWTASADFIAPIARDTAMTLVSAERSAGLHKDEERGG